jgi:hypothetical protein
MASSTIPSKRSADAQEQAWVADEDRFVLQQAKKKSIIRIKSSRAQAIDWLTVILVVIDPSHNELDDEVEIEDVAVRDPESVFKGMDAAQLAELAKGIENFITLEKSQSNRDYWNVSCVQHHEATSRTNSK